MSTTNAKSVTLNQYIIHF